MKNVYLWIYSFPSKMWGGIPDLQFNLPKPQLCPCTIKPASTGMAALTVNENIHCACAKLFQKRQELRVWSTAILTLFCQKSTSANFRMVLPSFTLFFDFIISTRTCRQVLHWQCSGRLETHRGSLSVAWLSASTFLSLCGQRTWFQNLLSRSVCP